MPFSFNFATIYSDSKISFETQSCGANAILENGTGFQPFRIVWMKISILLLGKREAKLYHFRWYLGIIIKLF